MSSRTPSASLARTESVPKGPKLLLIVSIILVLAGGMLIYNRQNASKDCSPVSRLAQTTLSGNGATMTAEIAKESEDKIRGLSGRNCLDRDTAMIFPYERTSDYCFWMKDMKFPIDMIWLDDDKKIVTVEANISPETYPDNFCPSGPAQYVIEVDAGVAAANGWQDGTVLDFSL